MAIEAMFFSLLTGAPISGHSDYFNFGISDYQDRNISVGMGLWLGYSLWIDTHASLLSGTSYNLTATWNVLE